MGTKTAFSSGTIAGAVETELLSQCPNCGSADFSFFVSGRDRQLRVTEQVFDYSKCPNCGVTFQSCRPVESGVGKFYSESYSPHGARPVKRRPKLWPDLDRAAAAISDWIIRAATFRAEVARFYADLKHKPRFLDFGCGAGKFLDRARKLGCETIGMDFSAAARAEVARRGHRALSITEADWALVEKEPVDVVRMNHVIEHLYDSASAMRRLYSGLTPGGTIHVATPNAASLTAEIYREHWWGLDCPRHIVIFTPDSLRQLMETVGFVRIRILQEPLTKDMARSWIYREIDVGRHTSEDVASFADDGVLNLRFALACRKAAKLGRADRIHLFARKPTV